MPAPALYYLRHGETVWNAEGRLQGHRDSDLTERGRAQADRCGAILHRLVTRGAHDPAAFDYVASPLGRARATMERVRSALGLDPAGYRTDGRLAEMSFGDWEGLTFVEVRMRAPEVLAARERDLWGFAPPGGESYTDLIGRVREWHASLVRDTVVVAHGGTARALFALLGMASRENATRAAVAQGVVYHFAGGQMSRHE
jgi:probable phosphoglycerate mutase